MSSLGAPRGGAEGPLGPGNRIEGAIFGVKKLLKKFEALTFFFSRQKILRSFHILHKGSTKFCFLALPIFGL